MLEEEVDEFLTDQIGKWLGVQALAGSIIVCFAYGLRLIRLFEATLSQSPPASAPLRPIPNPCYRVEIDISDRSRLTFVCFSHSIWASTTCEKLSPRLGPIELICFFMTADALNTTTLRGSIGTSTPVFGFLPSR